MHAWPSTDHHSAFHIFLHGTFYNFYEPPPFLSGSQQLFWWRSNTYRFNISQKGGSLESQQHSTALFPWISAHLPMFDNVLEGGNHPICQTKFSVCFCSVNHVCRLMCRGFVILEKYTRSSKIDDIMWQCQETRRLQGAEPCLCLLFCDG